MISKLQVLYPLGFTADSFVGIPDVRKSCGWKYRNDWCTIYFICLGFMPI